MSELAIVVLGLAGCAVLVVGPILVSAWLKRRCPRVHAAATYALALAFVCLLLTSLFVIILSGAFPTEQATARVVGLILGPLIVAGFVVGRHRRALCAVARKRFALSFLPRLLAALLLGLAPMSWSQDFYSLLRWFVFGAACLVVLVAWSTRQFFWVWMFSMTALLFNPVRVLRFSHVEIWHVADFLIGGLFVVSCLFVRENVGAAPRGVDGGV
ncbi:MAG: hypothetical protein QOC81_1824 [Thermoanaerobaculia bacterium]|jgi:MFS family permease|nr:hypothetical protein [Thermoanaerobaculia bacterium]